MVKKGDFVRKLAKKLEMPLKPFCKKIMVVGSIRRKEKNPIDVDIVLIPKDKKKILEFMNKQGKFLQGGTKKAAFKIKGIKVELYYTTSESWGATILSYTGPKGSSIGLRVIAKDKGMLLNQYGLFNKNTGRKIAGKTEKQIYKALGKSWKKPEKR